MQPRDVELNFSLTLPDELYRELIDSCRERSCSPKQFAAESLEIVLASSRLPRVAAAPHGARIGTREIEEVEPVGYPVHCDSL
jgi:hypothetical protein